MSFLNPWLLLGALGLSLPILAHLLNRYQVKHTDWAAMRFLNRNVRVRSRQLRLRDIFLLILRCLALLLLVLAVSKPAVKNPDGMAAQIGERRAGVVIALDVSFSMRHGDGETTRFERAREKVEQIAESLVPGAPVSLLLLGDEHVVAARNMAYRADRFDQVLEDVEVTSGQLKMETISRELAKLARDMQAVEKEIYIVTDLQSKDWNDPQRWLLDGLRELSRLAATFIVPVQGESENLAITDFELFSGLLRKGTMARYQATIRNNGPGPVRNVRVKCLMEGVNVDSKMVPLIAGRSAQTVSFFVPFHDSGSVKLTAKLEKDWLPLDDVRYAVANIRERVSVLCVEGASRGMGLESFISKALQARGTGSGKEEFKVRSVSWLSLPSQELKTYDVVVLKDVPEITAQQAERLRDFVRGGNGLIWFAGDNMKAGIWNQRSDMSGGSLLPAAIGRIESVNDDKGAGVSLDPILSDHPICRPLRSLPKDLLSETQFHKLVTVEPLPSSVPLLNLSGSDTPILLEQSVGRGHVFMFTTSANPSWNNMALTPAFPMLMQQMVTYLTGREFETSQIVGSALSLVYADRPDANDAVFETPSGETVTVPVREHAGEYVAFLDHAREPGFYIARVSLQAPGQPIAVNVDTAESDVRCVSASEAQSKLGETGVTIAESTVDAIGDSRTGYEYWRSFMIAGLAILVLESLVASRLFRRARANAQNGDALA